LAFEVLSKHSLSEVAWTNSAMVHVDVTAASVMAANQITDNFADVVVTSDPHRMALPDL
jgi:hypothetical protein